MKKQVIFIYDPETEELTQVCDVRSVEPQKISELTHQAKVNSHAILKSKEEEKEKLLETIKIWKSQQ